MFTVHLEKTSFQSCSALILTAKTMCQRREYLVTAWPFSFVHCAKQQHSHLARSQHGRRLIQDGCVTGNTLLSMLTGVELEPQMVPGEDVYDLIEWAAKQPWSSGAVGMI